MALRPGHSVSQRALRLLRRRLMKVPTQQLTNDTVHHDIFSTKRPRFTEPSRLLRYYAHLTLVKFPDACWSIISPLASNSNVAMSYFKGIPKSNFTINQVEQTFASTVNRIILQNTNELHRYPAPRSRWETYAVNPGYPRALKSATDSDTTSFKGVTELNPSNS